MITQMPQEFRERSTTFSQLLSRCTLMTAWLIRYWPQPPLTCPPNIFPRITLHNT